MALVLVIGVLVIVAGSAMLALQVNSARWHAVDVLQARLESARMARAYSDQLKSVFMAAISVDADVLQDRSFSFPSRFWDVDPTSTRVLRNFDTLVLRAQSGSVAAADRDTGFPGAITWAAPFSEALTAQATIRASRPSMTLDVQTGVSVPVEATVWRIPAPAVSLLVTQSPPRFAFPVIVDSQPVFAFAGASLSFVPNLSLPAGMRLFQPDASVKLTAGASDNARLRSVYGLPPSSNAAYEIAVDDADAPPAGLVTVVCGTEHLVGLNLATYSGPQAIAITGSAARAGVVLLGAPATAPVRPPISVVSAGPLILAGSNARYVVAATGERVVRIFSAASETGPTWTLSPGGFARSIDWVGHLFVGSLDPSFDLAEDWSAANLTLHGSLHFSGGTLTQSGLHAGSLGEFRIVQPDWSAFPGRNPFTGALRYESFVACPLL